MKILIIEDEPPIAKQLEKYLKAYDNDVEIVKTINSIKSGIAYFKNEPQPDLIISDIELGDGICFEIFSEFSITCPIIFSTAYSEYWQKSFEINSIDYLLKPIKKKELYKSLEKYKKVQLYYGNNRNNYFADMLENLSKNKTYKSRFLIKIGKNFEVISIDDINYFYSEDKLSFIVTRHQKKYATYDSLDEIESQIDPFLFYRANRKHLINIKSIVKVQPYFNGKLSVELIPLNNEKQLIVISRNKASAFKKWLNQ